MLQKINRITKTKLHLEYFWFQISFHVLDINHVNPFKNYIKKLYNNIPILFTEMQILSIFYVKSKYI